MTAHHRHQASLEQVYDFSPQPTLTPDELAQADSTFTQLISHDHPRQQSPSFTRGVSRFSGFSSAAPASQKREAEKSIDSFAEYLFDNLFLPLTASGNKTPQPTPAALSAPVENVIGTPARLSYLRRDCLIRDHNRCVVTRKFNMPEAAERVKRDGSNAKDDDDQPLIYAPGEFSDLEVAHIIPHSIMSATATGDQLELSESKKSALAILRMFDPDVIHLIEGSYIDGSTNALTLTQGTHRLFGTFKFYFEKMDSSIYPQNTYRIDSRETIPFSRPEGLPVTRTLLVSPNHTIDPPSSKLLGIHRVISIILNLSAAGDHIDKILRDMEELWVRSDGSAQLGSLVSLKLGGWFDGVAT